MIQKIQQVVTVTVLQVTTYTTGVCAKLQLQGVVAIRSAAIVALFNSFIAIHARHVVYYTALTVVHHAGQSLSIIAPLVQHSR